MYVQHGNMLAVLGYSQTASGLGQLPPGYQPYQGPSSPLQTGYAPTYGATTITVHPQEIIIVGACPACRVSSPIMWYLGMNRCMFWHNFTVW